MNTLRTARWHSVSRFLLAAAVLAVTPFAHAQGPDSYPQSPYDQQPMDQGDPSQDPPSRVGRLSVLQGNVSFEPQGTQDFSAAEVNYPLTNGDRLYADSGALAEVQAGQLAVRLGQMTDLTVTELDAQYAQFGLAQGSVHLRAYALDPDTTTELDTPNASVILTQPGDIRVDVSPDGSVSTIYVLNGQVQVTADGVDQYLSAGQNMQIRGMGPSMARMVGRNRPDALDSFSADRDRTYDSYMAATQGYVNADTIGASDLGAYGDWVPSGDYGPVWYPRGVDADWAPYTNGHWVSVAPWGWTWVGYEPWGFAPFHYGRWARFGNRWGWIPGPPVVHPVYSPALVAFVGGGGFSISVGGGSGFAAWFPLGPREVYRPWYRTSPVYVNRVNVTNIYSRNTADIRRIYGSRNNVYVNVNVNYVNRGFGTVAVSARDFGSRRPVRDVRIRDDRARQFANAPVINRPPVAAPSRPIAGPPVHALPPHGAQRPVFDSQNPRRPSPHGPPPNGDNRGRFDNGGRPGNDGRGGQYPGQGNDNGNRNDGRFNGDRGNDGRFNGTQPPNNGQPSAPVVRPGQPGSTQPGNAQPGNNDRDYRNNGGRFNGDRGNDNRGNDGRFNNGQPGNNGNPPVQPTRPDNGGRNDGGRFNGDRTNDNRGGDNRVNGSQPGNNGATTAQPTQPVRNDNGTRNDGGRFNGDRNNDNRFNNGGQQQNNGGRPTQNSNPAVTMPQGPAPAVTPNPPRVRPEDYQRNNKTDQPQVRPGPQSRQTPDGPVRMNPQPDQNQQRFQRPQPAQPQPQAEPQRMQPQPQPQQRQEQPRPEQFQRPQQPPQMQPQQQRQAPPPQVRPQAPRVLPPARVDPNEKK